MSLLNKLPSRVALFCTLAAAVLMTTASQVKAAVLTIDSSQSFLSIEVGGYDDPSDPATWNQITFPQVPGSASTTLQGTLTTGYTGWSLSIGSGNIVFNNQSADMEPGPGGAMPGSAPANYGLLVDLLGAVTGPGAVRGTVASVSLGETALAGNQFIGNGAILELLAGALDVNLQSTFIDPIVTSVNIAGNSGTNAGGPGTFDLVGLDATLTLPIYVEAIVEVEISEGTVLPLVARFEGQIVATGLVPEPGTYALLGTALVGLVAAGRRRLRRS